MMIEKIKETDQFLTQKQAKKKCLDFEANQLEQLSQKIEEKNKKELEDFNHQYKTEIEKVKNDTKFSKWSNNNKEIKEFKTIYFEFISYE